MTFDLPYREWPPKIFRYLDNCARYDPVKSAVYPGIVSTKEVAVYSGGTEMDDVTQARKIKWRNTLERFGAVTRSLH